MEIPTINIPPVQKIKTVEIPLPKADVPYYVPLVVPPSDLRDEQGVKPKETKTEAPPAPKLKIPNLPPIPIPSTEVLVTTSIAAVTAVAATKKVTDQAAATTKLKALGLTDDEIVALIN